MKHKHRPSPKKIFDITLLLIVWAFVIWLLFPILTVSAMDFWNTKTYFWRTVLGIAILIVFFGKTIFDLFFPLDSSNKESLLQTIFLTVYGLFVAIGILYIAGRLVVFYFKSSNSDFFTL
ncbi:MAG: hypothetical protein PVF22_05525 [Candidatus Aminicenantes bacterium]|jgi:hypothetical protein